MAVWCRSQRLLSLGPTEEAAVSQRSDGKLGKKLKAVKALKQYSNNMKALVAYNNNIQPLSLPSYGTKSSGERKLHQHNKACVQARGLTLTYSVLLHPRLVHFCLKYVCFSLSEITRSMQSSHTFFFSVRVATIFQALSISEILLLTVSIYSV